MVVYMDLVMLLNFFVDFLLLMAADRLSGQRTGCVRMAAASALGAIYAGACMLPGFAFLQNIIWRMVSLTAISVISYGWDLFALRRGVLFVILSMALGGAAVSFHTKGIHSIILCAGFVTLLCIYGVGGRLTRRELVQMQLHYNGKCKKITALVDTGNTLVDPLTSQNVAVLGSDLGKDLLGLTEKQLRDPIGTLSAGGIAGLRLIPYNAVGVSGGLLLAVAMDAVTVNGKQVGNVVAFAPSVFQSTRGYQGLVGGYL